MKITLNPYIQYIHKVFSKYLSPVLNLLKATTYMVFSEGQIGGQIGGQIDENTAIQCNLTHLDVIEGTVGVHFEAMKKPSIVPIRRRCVSAINRSGKISYKVKLNDGHVAIVSH